MSENWLKAKLKKLVRKVKDVDVENKLRAESTGRHEDLSSFLAAPAKCAEEVQEQSISLGYPGSTRGELSFEDLSSQQDEVKLMTEDNGTATVSNPSDKLTRVDSLVKHFEANSLKISDTTAVSRVNEVDRAEGQGPQGAATVSDPSNKLTRVNSLVKHFEGNLLKISDATAVSQVNEIARAGLEGDDIMNPPKKDRQLMYDYDGKSEIESAVVEIGTCEHSFDIKERAQMKAKGAIPKIRAIRNYAKPLNPIDYVNPLSKPTSREVAIVETGKPSDFLRNPSKSSGKAYTKMETSEKNKTSGVADKEDRANPKNSTDDLLSIQDSFLVENKLVISSDGEKSVENQGNETKQSNTSPKGIGYKPEEKLMAAAQVELILTKSRDERDCVVESVPEGSTEITDLLTTAQLQMNNLKIRPKKNESSLDRRGAGQERRLGIANSLKDKATERHQSTKANRNRPRSTQRSKVSRGEGGKSRMNSSGSDDNGRIAEKSNFDSNTRKRLVGHVRKVPGPKWGAKEIPRKAAQHSNFDRKTKNVTKGGNVSSKERPHEKRKAKNSVSENGRICKTFPGKETKVNASQEEESSNSVKMHNSKTVETELKTGRKGTEGPQHGLLESALKKPNSNPKGRSGTPQKVSLIIPNKTVIERADLEGYLENFLPSMTTFKVTDIDKSDEENSTATVEFASTNQAKKAVGLLTKNFDKTGIRAHIVNKNVTLHKDVVVEFLRTQKEEVSRKGNILVEQHQTKIDKQTTEINKLKTTKFVSLDTYNKRKIECEALESKLEELTLQRDEFTIYHTRILEKIEALGKHNKPNGEVKKLRLEFGLECRKLSTALPIYARRSHIIDTVSNNPVSVILGETGSGKSTQLVQYLHQAQNLGLGEVGSKMIVCTQPRKVAAQSLAKHVADEMGTTYGGIVGYRAGFVSKTSAQTKVLFTTDHNLLNECLKDPLLEKYSCVIIDEAHERSIYTDLLLGMIKKCLKERNDLRVIVTSATIDPEVFVRYFGDAPVLRVSGRMFPVEVVYKDNSEPSRENYLQEAVEKVREIHEQEPEGDVLVFLTSPLETQKACERLESRADLVCLPLHGQLQAQEQQRVFEPVALGKRKIVFATNSAETSITIPGIKYVVDTGLVKEKVFDAKKSMSALVVKAISKSSAEQRKGRAGRMSSGKCYRLYTEKEFKAMDHIALPEILRVHLGQALLKLMEIGVADPLSFDFVQSPSEDALQSAVKILKQLKAIDVGGITRIGKRLALMPVEPRMAKVIFDAIECGCGLEGIAVAALSSISGSVFYRMGTEEDKKQADYYKTRFCQPEGDIQTFLQVYKEWDSVPEKKKSAWCVQNYINSKSIRACRETIIEIQRILKKDLDIIVQYKFSENFDRSSISNILLDCFRSNLGYFTGHSKAGYFIVFDAEDRFLQIHPSSSLSYLASTPKWVAFLDVLKTSSDYMLNVVTLDDSEIQRKIDTEDFIINEKKLDEITVSDNVVAEVGSSLMSFLVGPKFQNLKAMEKELNAKYGKIVVLEAQREKSQMKAFTTPSLSEDIKKYLQDKIAPEQLKLQKELAQYPVTYNSYTKAVIEAGGLCSGILMPDETRTLLLRNVPDEWTKSDVKLELEKFGEISEVFPFIKSRNRHGGNKPWGKVTFIEADSVKKVMDYYEGVVVLHPEGIGRMTMTKNEFKIRLQWCRRPTKGLAFVTPRDPEDAMMLSGVRMVINGSIVTIRLDRKEPTKLFISKLSSGTTENDVKHALEDKVPIESVRMPRENVGETQAEMLQAITGRMNMKVMEFAKRDEFSVTIMKPKPANFDYFGFVTFSNPETGLVAINRLNGSQFDGKQLTAYPELRTSLHVQKDVYATLKNRLDGAIQQLRADHRSVKLSIKELKSGHFVINLEADNVDLMSSIRNSLHEMISGQRIECASKEDEQALFSPAGRDLFSRLQKYLGLLIRVDNRLRTVTMYGDQSDITEGKEEIQVFLGRFQNLKTREISLRGEGRPPGLMKYLLLEHGLEMTTLRQDTGVAMLTLILQKHMLTAAGNVESLEKLAYAVSDAMKKLEKDCVVSRPDDIDCTVCFCPIDGKIYRLEDCGHPCCSECIRDLIKNGINSKQFPILCTDEVCQHPLVWKDFNNWLGSEQRQQLLNSSVEKFVAQNPETYKFCISADCEMVYRVGYNEGSPYECANCGITICTTCHAQYHHGLSCAMYLSKLKTPDYDLEEWVREKTDIRTLCPGCKAPIEKNGGCSHVHCTQCNIHICWWCKKTFSSSGDTYNHQGSCNRIGTL